MLLYIYDQGLEDGVEGIDPVDMSPVPVKEINHGASIAVAITYFSLYSLITRFPWY